MARRASRVEVVGPLEPYQVGFEARLAEAGYTRLSAANHVRLMRHLSIWLESHDLAGTELTPAMVQEYLEFRRVDGYTSLLSVRGLAPLLAYLRSLGVAPRLVAAAVVEPLDVLVERYRHYLVTERGLVVATVAYYLSDARAFLARWVDGSGSRLGELTAAQVSGFVVEQCARRSVGSAKILVTVLRSLLRFLVLDGSLKVGLNGAVPAVAGWRGSHLPKGVGPDEVAALLASCHGRGAVGRRDRAVLLLLARLGLRAVEVARLWLDDIDWRRGEVTIRGKGHRDERLPLPVDVGTAIVDYLRHGRPTSTDRAVFLHVRAPFAAMTCQAASHVVRLAALRAGLGALGPHRLRHTAATQMLRAESPLIEVGQVLRHRSPATTAIYAKVDRVRLRELAMTWPGAGR